MAKNKTSPVSNSFNRGSSSKKNSSSLNSAQLFGFSIVIGGISIILGTWLGTWLDNWFSMMINFGIPVCIIIFYSYTVNKDASDALSIEQKADSVYYMGFILTLFAMTASLVALAYSDELRFNAIVINFGLALTTTILGLSIRIMWLQLSSQSLADAESILRQKIMRRSQDLQDQTEKVVGSLTALSNQLVSVSDPLKQSFNSLGNLDTSSDSAAQSLSRIANLAESLETSVSLLKENIGSDMVANIEGFSNSLNSLNPKISNSVIDIENSLDKLQKNIERTDRVIADSKTNLEKNSSSLKEILIDLLPPFTQNFWKEKLDKNKKKKEFQNKERNNVISSSDRASQFKDKN